VAVLDRLEAYARKDGDGLAWWTSARHLPSWQRARHPEGYFNLGVAHGVSGVVGFLASCAHAGIADPRIEVLLQGGLRFIARQRRSGAGRLPSWVGEQVAARNAWCYGDLGAAAALLQAARAFPTAFNESLAGDLLEAAVFRPDADARAVDACLCHGSAGLAHLFNRVYQATGVPAAHAAALRWYDKTIELYRPRGYVFPTSADAAGRFDWVCKSSLLDGSAGVLIALVAACSAEAPTWDRMLLCDLSPRGSL
jgi:hypothetical protein